MYIQFLPKLGTIIEWNGGDGWEIAAFKIPDIVAISWINQACPELRLGLKGGFQWPEEGSTAIVVNNYGGVALALCPASPSDGGNFLLLQIIRSRPSLAD